MCLDELRIRCYGGIKPSYVHEREGGEEKGNEVLVRDMSKFTAFFERTGVISESKSSPVARRLSSSIWCRNTAATDDARQAIVPITEMSPATRAVLLNPGKARKITEVLRTIAS